MKIALFGGSFNPIDNYHMNIIKQIQESKIVDKVWILPCGKHDFGKKLTEKRHRVNMIKLAIKNLRKVKICDYEIRTNTGITLNTIRFLKRKYSHKFYFVIGSDITYEITQWNNYKELFRETEFIIFKRKKFPIKKIKGMKIMAIFKSKASSLSSTTIRNKVQNKKDIEKLVPAPIKDYIKKHKLYK